MSGKEDLDARAAAGETVVPGGTGGKSLEAQQHLADGMHFYSIISFIKPSYVSLKHCLQHSKFHHHDR